MEYSDKISLTKNSRGMYSIDTIMGCFSGTINNPNGCYGDCFAVKSAKRYGYDFSKVVRRGFESKHNETETIKKISKIPLEFIRIGTNGDPSEDWDHTLNVLGKISKANKEIVLVTKHWRNLDTDQLRFISKFNVCINTSISAMDNAEHIQNRLLQYNAIKKYCKSVLRIVSCDFNLHNDIGVELNETQKKLFNNINIIDTVFRPSKNNPLVISGVINTCKKSFLNKPVIVSALNKKTYFGKCSKCPDMCGINFQDFSNADNRIKLIKQTNLFK